MNADEAVDKKAELFDEEDDGKLELLIQGYKDSTPVIVHEYCYNFISQTEETCD